MRASHTTPAIANRKVHETFTLRRATRYGGFNALSVSSEEERKVLEL